MGGDDAVTITRNHSLVIIWKEKIKFKTKQKKKQKGNSSRRVICCLCVKKESASVKKLLLLLSFEYYWVSSQFARSNNLVGGNGSDTVKVDD